MLALSLLLNLCCRMTLILLITFNVGETTLIKSFRSIFSMIVLAGNSEILLWEFAHVWNWVTLLELLNHHHVRNLLLRTLHKSVNLALSLMLNRIVTTLHTGWVHWQLASWTLALFFSWASNNNPWLGTRRTRAWRSYLSMMALLGLFKVGTFDLLILILILISPCILCFLFVLKGVQTTRVVTSSLNVITLCSWLSLVLIRRNKLICEIWLVRICTCMILFTQEHWCILIIFDAFLGLLM